MKIIKNIEKKLSKSSLSGHEIKISSTYLSHFFCLMLGSNSVTKYSMKILDIFGELLDKNLEI